MKFLFYLSDTSRLLGWLDRAVIWVTLVLGGLTLAGMTGLSVVNVLVMRKALNAPIRGAEDIMILALVVVVALAIPFGARAGAHIEIELFENSFSELATRISLVLMKLIGTVTMGFLSWRLWTSGGQAARFGESSQNLIISFGPFYRLLAISTALYCLILILELTILAQGKVLKWIDLRGEKT